MRRPKTLCCGNETDTLPGRMNPRKERRWVAPFALANREQDYRFAWAFFSDSPSPR